MDPTAINAGVTLCFADQTAVASNTTAKAGTATAVITAQQNDDKAGHDLTSSTAKLSTDVQAVKDLIDTTFGTAAVVPAAA